MLVNFLIGFADINNILFYTGVFRGNHKVPILLSRCFIATESATLRATVLQNILFYSSHTHQIATRATKPDRIVT